MYNDFKLISEEKLNILMQEYNKKLKVKINNFNNEDFKDKLNSLLQNLKNCLHYLKNLILNIKRSINLEELQVKYKEIQDIIDKIKLLYEISDIETLENSNNYNYNVSDIIESLLSSLEIIFEFLIIENNAKIKISLENIFFQIIDIIKFFNKIDLKTTKIVSLFKYFK